jgi:hypothetical protein
MKRDMIKKRKRKPLKLDRFWHYLPLKENYASIIQKISTKCKILLNTSWFWTYELLLAGWLFWQRNYGGKLGSHITG